MLCRSNPSITRTLSSLCAPSRHLDCSTTSCACTYWIMRAVCAHLVRLFLLLYTLESRTKWIWSTCVPYGEPSSIFLSLPTLNRVWSQLKYLDCCSWMRNMYLLNYWALSAHLSSIVFASPDRNIVMITEYNTILRRIIFNLHEHVQQEGWMSERITWCAL
jgi:hypothetical protein